MSRHHLAIALELTLEAAREGRLAGKGFRVRGGCMAPLIADGDEVILAPAEQAAAPLRPGQIVLAKVGAELLCHRLLALDGESCQLAGDADLRLDILTRAAILGRVAAVKTTRFGGARLELAEIPSTGERFFAAWHRWSCRHRRLLHRLLEGPRRRLLARGAARSWRDAAR